jgi:pSer/pThr/pTyr-binding forkhead associated (FHA) protein
LFPITVSELTFGSDTKQAVIALDDPSVEPLHARLWREENGTFYIEDFGSIAGTWVNYGSADENGMPLEHGDLIHIGKIGYRFTLSKPAKVRKPVVIPLDGSQPEEEE